MRVVQAVHVLHNVFFHPGLRAAPVLYTAVPICMISQKIAVLQILQNPSQ